MDDLAKIWISKMVYLLLLALTLICIHLIRKRLSSELLHCALLHTQTATHHGCNDFLNIIASAYYETTTFVYWPWKQCGQQCFMVLACNNVQIRYIHGALRSGYPYTMQQFKRQPFLNYKLFFIRTILSEQRGSNLPKN